jgi:hypothetical protein
VVRRKLLDISRSVDPLWTSMRTVIVTETETLTMSRLDWSAHMVTHHRDLDIVTTVGAFDGGQEAHIHRRHSRIKVRGAERSSSNCLSGQTAQAASP